MRRAVVLVLLALPCAGQCASAALDFDGYDDCVAVPSDPALDGFADFCIECWFKTSVSGICQSLVSKFINDGGPSGYYLRMSPTNRIRFDFGFPDGAQPGRDVQMIALDASDRVAIF